MARKLVNKLRDGPVVWTTARSEWSELPPAAGILCRCCELRSLSGGWCRALQLTLRAGWWQRDGPAPVTMLTLCERLAHRRSSSRARAKLHPMSVAASYIESPGECSVMRSLISRPAGVRTLPRFVVTIRLDSQHAPRLCSQRMSRFHLLAAYSSLVQPSAAGVRDAICNDLRLR